MKEKIEEFKKLANRPDAWDKDVERLINDCGGDVEKAAALILDEDRRKESSEKIQPLSVGFNSKDGEIRYTCRCGHRFGGWDIMIQPPNENNNRNYCPGCRRELAI